MSTAAKFAGGKIPVDDIEVAEIKNGKQELTVTVNDLGYSPAVLIVQKGIQTKIRFNAGNLSSCDNIVSFPKYSISLDLLNNEFETPYLTPDQDFTFQCGVGMLHCYVKVVDDINMLDIDAIKNIVSKFIPDLNISPCCGY